jgi:hypothetical protein
MQVLNAPLCVKWRVLRVKCYREDWKVFSFGADMLSQRVICNFTYRVGLNTHLLYITCY